MKHHKVRGPRELKLRECYQVGGTLHRTMAAAAKSEAWRMILERYVTPGEKLSDLASARGMDCECGEDTYYESTFYSSTCCMLHDRDDGYFARLHRRLWPMIVAKWESEAGLW